MDRLIRAEWTGNVRQLGNEIERAVALAGSASRISAEMLSEDLRGPSRAVEGGAFEPTDPDLNRSVDDLKRHMIRQAIEETGSKSKAAERLGIPRQSLQKMMKRLGLA
jgi:transcriptional regulator with PAS, ATPase and Fis domain